MPMYDFRCPDCERVFEVRRKMTEVADWPPVCGFCETACERLFSAPAINMENSVNAVEAMNNYHNGTDVIPGWSKEKTMAASRQLVQNTKKLQGTKEDTRPIRSLPGTSAKRFDPA